MSPISSSDTNKDQDNGRFWENPLQIPLTSKLSDKTTLLHYPMVGYRETRLGWQTVSAYFFSQSQYLAYIQYFCVMYKVAKGFIWAADVRFCVFWLSTTILQILHHCNLKLHWKFLIVKSSDKNGKNQLNIFEQLKRFSLKKRREIK